MTIQELFTKYRSYLTPPEIWRIVKYGVCGVSGGLLQVLFLYIFVDKLEWWYLQAVVVGFLISLVVVFTLQKLWTFEDYSLERLHRQSFLYGSIAMLALALNVTGMFILVDILHVWHILAQVMVVGAVGAFTFLLNRMFTFSTK